MPRHFRLLPTRAGRRRKPTRAGSRRRKVLLAIPFVIVLLAVGAWGIATAAGGDVVDNVEVGGRPVGGTEVGELRRALEADAAELAAIPVRLVTSRGELATTAGELGLTLDVDATAERVLDAGRGTPVLRPVRWLTSFVSPIDVEPVVRADVDTAYHTILGLEGEDRVPPIEPTMVIDEDGRLALAPGEPGSGIDVNAVAERLPAAALTGANPIVLTTEPVPLPPATTDEAVQAVVDEGNLVTDVPLVVDVAGQSTEVAPEDQRTWLRLADFPESPALLLDEEAAIDDLAARFPDLGQPPVDATVTLGEAGTPVVVPGVDGTGCCEAGAAEVLLAAMREGSGSVTLEATVREPELTTADVEAWAIREPVGGVRAWPDNRADEVGPGFTTFHAAGESRVTNIHRIADLVRGAVIPPGGSFSVNDHVGRRTTANGFVSAGAIRNGEHVSEVGGGVSQFATTLFNAAYFAGLDIREYQAHSEYFSRYPRGREATMGFPAPDLVIENTTPFGILIWTSYTSSSLTVTMWSSAFVAAEQTDISERSAGACDVVTTQRTRTYPDGSQVLDEFQATYRPGPGQFC